MTNDTVHRYRFVRGRLGAFTNAFQKPKKTDGKLAASCSIDFERTVFIESVIFNIIHIMRVQIKSQIIVYEKTNPRLRTRIGLIYIFEDDLFLLLYY